MARKPKPTQSKSKAQARKDPTVVPLRPNAWYVAVRKIRTWIRVDEGGDQFFQPVVTLAVDQETGLLLDLDVLEDFLQPQELLNRLIKLMLKPPRQYGLKPHRPAEIHFELAELAEAMEPLLGEFGVKALFRPQPENIDALFKELMEQGFGNEESIPGLLVQPGVTPELVGDVHTAALEFYQAQPWVELENEDLLAVQVGEQPEPYYVMVLGAGGSEYGLSVSRSWEALEAFFGAEKPQDVLDAGGQDALLFNRPPYVSFDDLEAIQQYGWELPEPDLVPTPWIVKEEGIVRPDAAMLKWYAAALRAIPVFTSQHLQRNPEGTHPDAEAQIEVEAAGEQVNVRIRYPGGDLSQIENRMDEMIAWSDEEDGEGDFDLDLVDRRAMEGDLARLVAGLGGVPDTDDPQLAEAQQRMYEAWEERSPAWRIALARQALELSPNCADAYVLLAQEQAKTARQAHDLFQKGVEAGQRALGEAFFKDRENIGHFWGILSTRPYMRALAGLAEVQWELDQREESLKNYRELLRLNPNDNQGIRYIVITLLQEMGMDDEARKLLKKYKGDYSAIWAYSAALLAFKKGGDQPGAQKALRDALGVNRHVADFLTGKKRMPAQLPAYISPGGEDEAVSYVAANLAVWRRTEGALAWLKAQMQQHK